MTDPLQMAHRRRAALTEAECTTYIMIPEGMPSVTIHARVAASILCLCCGMRSYNQHDIDGKYCGYCHKFHEG